MAQRETRAVTAFGKRFGTAFPQLADAEIEWEEEVYSLSGGPEVRHGLRMSVKEGYFQGTIRCGQAGCAEGGFEVERIIQFMVQDALEEREGVLVCGGWIDGPAGEEARPCVNAIRYQVRLTYRRRSGKGDA